MFKLKKEQNEKGLGGAYFVAICGPIEFRYMLRHHITDYANLGMDAHITRASFQSARRLFILSPHLRSMLLIQTKIENLAPLSYFLLYALK